MCVVDVRLPPTFNDEGVRAALEARRRIPGLPILILSQYVEQTFAAELFADGRGGVGYLLKDRVADVADFVDVRQAGRRGRHRARPRGRRAAARPRRARRSAGRADPARDGRDAADGGGPHQPRRSRNGLHISESAVEKHVSTIFGKLDLPRSEDDHRRVMAVAAYLRR